MHLDHAYSEAHDLLHVMLRVIRVPRMHTTARDQPLRILFAIFGDELVDLWSESHQLRSNIVNQYSAVDANFIEMLEEGLWRAGKLDDLWPVCPLLLHGLQCSRFEHLKRLDVDVAIGDDHRPSVVPD